MQRRITIFEEEEEEELEDEDDEESFDLLETAAHIIVEDDGRVWIEMDVFYDNSGGEYSPHGGSVSVLLPEPYATAIRAVIPKEDTP